jgi:hypothetical protein
MTLVSCERTYITDEDLLNQKQYTGKVQRESKIIENGFLYVMEKDLGDGRNYFFNCPTCEESFLFLTCNVDCNEYVDKSEWNVKTNSFAFLVRSKFQTNFKTKNRLILYKVANNKPVKLLDTVKDVYKTFSFEGSDFVYTLEIGEIKKISLP